MTKNEANKSVLETFLFLSYQRRVLMETSQLDGSLRSQAERSTTFAALKCKKRQDVTCTNVKYE